MNDLVETPVIQSRRRKILSQELFIAIRDALDLPKNVIELKISLGIERAVRIEVEYYLDSIDPAKTCKTIGGIFESFELVPAASPTKPEAQ